nr:type II toxin-antitoxin system YafQ family toxin [Enterococcus hirae]
MKIKRTPTFKRNYKSLKKKHYDMQKLENVLELLVQQRTDILYQKSDSMQY